MGIPFRVWFGIFFQSVAALMFEVSLSRLLAIRLWYHFAFLIISCALLGYALSGIYLLLFRSCSRPFVPSFLFACTLLPLFVLFQQIPFDPTLLALVPWQWMYLFLLYFLLTLPFFFCGLTISLLLRQYPQQSFLLYSGDLIGGAVGSAGFFLITLYWKEMEWLAITVLVGCLAAGCLAQGWNRRIALMGAVIGFMGYWQIFGMPDWHMSPYKTLSHALLQFNSRTLNTSWDAVSRVDWLTGPMVRSAPGLSLNFRKNLPSQIGITIDGEGLTAFSPWNTDLPEYTRNLPSWLVYKFSPAPQNSLILQVVGGQEVLSAVNAHVPKILVQTENKLISQWLIKQNSLPHVSVVPEKARTLLSSSSETYDRILISLEGSLPAGATGMNALRESSLETVEGGMALLRRLSPDGWFGIHRYLLPPPRGELRWIATMVESMKQLGWKPDRHLGIFRTVSTIMIVGSVQEWSEADKHRFVQFCADRGYTPIYYPEMEWKEANQVNRFARPIYAEAVKKLLEDPQTFFSESIYDLTPVTDDRPFFYHFLRWEFLPEIYISLDRKWEGLVEGGLLLPLLFLQILLLVFILLLLPILVHRNTLKVFSGKMSYFFWIGLGFMGVEIALFEKLILFLGEPVYSFALVLSVLLLASGIGSGISRYLTGRLLDWGHLLLLGALILYYFGFSKVLSEAAGFHFLGRLVIATISIGVLGVIMGIPFPRGIFLISSTESSMTKDRIAVAWCLNGCASAIGPIGAILLAQTTGLSSLFLWAAGSYSVALLLLFRLK